MDLAEAVRHAQRLGSIVSLATVTPAGRPHVVPVHLDWSGDRAYCTIGRTDQKTHNLRHRPEVCIHYPVGERTGWDSLIVWGSGRVLTEAADKRRLWTVLSYDLDEFEPGGPDHSPDTWFLEVEPRRVLLLRRYGFDGREEWRASG